MRTQLIAEVSSFVFVLCVGVVAKVRTSTTWALWLFAFLDCAVLALWFGCVGGANGGLFFDKAPGTNGFTTADGTKVEVVEFTINAATSTIDEVDDYDIGASGVLDMTATLVLRVSPAPLLQLTAS